jgi:hypothetical protein
MKAVRSVAGAAVVLMIGALLLIGIGDPTGSAILSPLGDSAAATGRAIQANIPGLGLVQRVAGDPMTAIGIAAVVALLATWLIPGVRSGRGMVLTGVGAALLAAVLYQPSLIGGGG